MKFPCEMIVWKVLPAIRAELARELQKNGLTQREIAQKLGITEAAVSQYLSGKRALDFKISKELDKSIGKAVKSLESSTQPFAVIEESCKICREIRKGGYLCKEHMLSSDLPSTCKICMEVKNDTV